MSELTVCAKHSATPSTASTVRPVSHRPIGTLIAEAAKRLAAKHEPEFGTWWSVRKVDLPEGPLGPGRSVWLGCACFATAAAVFTARADYDDALRSLLGELLLAEGDEA